MTTIPDELRAVCHALDQAFRIALVGDVSIVGASGTSAGALVQLEADPAPVPLELRAVCSGAIATVGWRVVGSGGGIFRPWIAVELVELERSADA